MIWMLITVSSPTKLSLQFFYFRFSSSSTSDNFSPRLELLVSDAVKRQMTKNDEKHQKMMTWYWSVRFQPDVTISWRDYFIRGKLT
ncbi:hypothetical protein HID58_063655 [Brassica napus]|uniref:Uncharacterized protein n=1 Tax=Brassica napus TaxID=3708 RepID=A0ABQ8A4Y1_BRANA|nr:hypothetical protein HID58_063655 [Brassica napus]